MNSGSFIPLSCLYLLTCKDTSCAICVCVIVILAKCASSSSVLTAFIPKAKETFRMPAMLLSFNKSIRNTTQLFYIFRCPVTINHFPSASQVDASFNVFVGVCGFHKIRNDAIVGVL